jgi:hypothetical protein
MKQNTEKFVKIYFSIIGGSGVTHSIYNMVNAPYKYKQNYIDTYKNHKYASNVKQTECKRFVEKPTNFGISVYVMKELLFGVCKGIYMGIFFPITIPCSIYCMTIKTDPTELDKVKPS